MARNDVTIVLNAKDAEAVRAWQRMKQGIGQAEAELAKMGRTSRRSGGKAKGALGGVAASAGRLATRLTGIGSAIDAVVGIVSLLRKELDAVNERRRTFAEAQIDTATAERRAIFALGPTADITPEELGRIIRADTSGVPLKSQFLVAEAAISAAGQLGARRAVRTAQAAFRLRPDLPTDDLLQLTGGALELQKGFGEATPEQAVAGVLQSLTAARQQSVGEFAKNIAPQVAAARAFSGGRDDFRDLMALFLAVGQRSGDQTGRRTGTALIKLFKQLAVETSAAGIAPPDSGPIEQLEILRSGRPEAEKVRRRLLGALEVTAEDLKEQLGSGEISAPELQSEAKTFIAVTELLKPGSTTLQFVDTAKQAVLGLNDAAVRAEEGLLEVIRALPSQQAFEVQRPFGAALETIRGDPETALKGLRADKFAELIFTAGATKTEAEAQRFVKQAFARGGGPVEQLRALIHDLELFEERRLKRTRIDFAPGFDPLGVPQETQVDREATEFDRRVGEALTGVIATLQQQLEIVTEAQTQAALRPGAGAAARREALEVLFRQSGQAGEIRQIDEVLQGDNRRERLGELLAEQRRLRAKEEQDVRAAAARQDAATGQGRQRLDEERADVAVFQRIEKILQALLEEARNNRPAPQAGQPQAAPLGGLER